jgi:uncharacterized protein
MIDIDDLLRPWLGDLATRVGGLELYDAHTHIGLNDPDGFKQCPDELVAALESAGARGVVFPMHEPDGYAMANDAALELAAGSQGRLDAFCRIDPNARGAVVEARRCLDDGARGIKLHPRAERFTLGVDAVRDLVALAHERRAAVLIHAGRGVPGLGEDTVHLSDAFPEARMILAHAAISDIAWLWRVLPQHRNLFVDTSWWNPTDVCALFALAPPGQILWASDSPYGRPLPAAVQVLRCALQTGLDPDQVRAVTGGQLARVLDGADPADLGPAPGPPARALHPLLERVVVHLVAAVARAFVHADHAEPLGLARLACAVGEDGPHADICAAVLELLNLYERDPGAPTEARPISPSLRLLVLALYVARTPDVPVGGLPASVPPTRAEAEQSSTS